MLSVGNKQPEKVVQAEMIIKGETVVCQRDSDASVNVIPLMNIKNAVLEESKKKLHICNGTMIHPKEKKKLSSC